MEGSEWMEEVTEPKKPAKVKMTPVKVIEKVGVSRLVEYTDPKKGTLRTTIPADIIKDGQVPSEELLSGAPHGVEWEKLKVKSIDPVDLARAFRDEGIFTLEDLGQKRQSALICLYRLSGLLLSDILEQVQRRFQ